MNCVALFVTLTLLVPIVILNKVDFMKPDGPASSDADKLQSPHDRSRRSNRGLVTVVRIGLVTLLVIYWSSMFFGTHLPQMPQGLTGHSDKLLHFCAYGGLAVLLLSWRITRGRVSMRQLLLFWLMIGAYGIFDEVTQPLVGRDCDIKDWLADLIGAAIGLAVTWPVATWLLAPRPALPNSNQP
jgi:VanZ family protein